ncbi:MAG: LysE family transporter [Thermoanaerobaculales bacterium]|nr:LysE family transporter [Thermoanaerobaculales bacterium]
MLEFFIAAAVFGLSGGLSPGPLLTLVVSETLARGRNSGLAVAMSPLITDGPAIAAAVFLLSRIENSDPALGFISIAGGALLTTYGIAGLRGSDLEVEEVATRRGLWASLGKGVSANFLNPNPYLFWLTIGTPILIRAHDSSWALAIGFLAAFYLCLVGSKCVLVLLVARSRAVLRGRAYLFVNRILAIALLVFAVIFIREGLLRLTG